MIYVEVAVIPPPSFVPSLCVPASFLAPALGVELLRNESILGGRGREKLLLDLHLYLNTSSPSHTRACALTGEGGGMCVWKLRAAQVDLSMK